MNQEEWVKAIEDAKGLLREAGYLIDVCWTKDDIRQAIRDRGIKPVEPLVGEVYDYLIDNFDANQGISWETINQAINLK